MEEFAAVLAAIGLEQYLEAFRAADVDLDVLPLLTDDDLKEIGVSLGHRRKLLAASRAGELRPSVSPETPDAPPAQQHTGEEQRRQVTVVFCDLVGSSDLTQRVEPEEMGRIIRLFQDGAAGAVSRFDGFVDRFMGDGMLALFGYPRAHEDAAERAVRAALAIVDMIGSVTTQSGEPISVRVAIASGPAFFGEIIEHGGAREPIITGEVVNLAARLQTVAPADSIVIAPQTRRLLRDLFELVDLGTFEFKGIGRPIRVWRVVTERLAGTRFEAVHAHTHTVSPVVGREAEIALLQDRWQSASLGEGQVVLLSAEAGMGKSRIAQVMRDYIADLPHIAIRYQCSPFHRNSALYPAIAQLQHAARIAPGDPPAVKLAKLRSLASQAGVGDPDAVVLLAELLSIPAEDNYAPLGLNPEEQKQRTLQVLVDQLLGLAREKPVLLLVEDAHWIDPTTHELISHVVVQLQQSAVLMLVTYRPEFRPDWVNLSHVTTLALNGLPRRQAMALIQHVAGAKALPSELVEQILSKTDGIPLFVEELAKAILELGVLREEDGRYELIDPLPTLAIPDTLHDSLLARIERHPSVKELAQIGSVIGREFAFAHLSALASVKGDALNAAIRELLRAELVHERGPSRSTFVFKHALIQDAAYSTLVIARRQQLHAQCAEILQELAPEIRDVQPELLAHHYTEAGQHETAVQFWLKAGKRAAERSANLEAIAHLRNGIRVVALVEDADRRPALELALQLEMGVPLIATRGYAAPETTAAWERARALAEQRNDQPRLVRTLYGLWAARCSLGETRVALSIADRIVDSGRQLADDGVEIVGRRVRGLTLQTLGDLPGARAELERALAAYDPQRHAPLAFQFGQDARVAANTILATVQWLEGRQQQSRRVSLEAVDQALALRHANSLGYTLAYGACLVAVLRCDEVETLRLSEQLIGLAGKHRLDLWQAYGHAYKGWALAWMGRVEEGETLLDQATAGFSRAGSGLYAPLVSALAAVALRRAGRTQEAAERLAACIAEAERREEMWCVPELLRLQARQADDAGAAERARALRDRALGVARAHGLVSWELRIACDMARAGGDRDGPDAAVERVRGIVQRIPEPASDALDWRRATAILAGGSGVVPFRPRGVAG